MAQEDQKHAVELYVYDLSRGMAKQLAPQLLGIELDGVWHTSVVVHGREFFYGHGIQSAHPGTTHHGEPVEKVLLGHTSLDLEVVEMFLEEMKESYTPENYNLFEHNCNHFSRDFAEFLIGEELAYPQHISDLPATVLNTPFGMMLRPMIENMLNPITTARTPYQ